MNTISKRALALAMFASIAVAAPAYAADRYDSVNKGETMDAYTFVKMCEAGPDGTVSKDEVMKQVGRMFDKHDTKKVGKMSKKQLEIFLQEFTRVSGG